MAVFKIKLDIARSIGELSKTGSLIKNIPVLNTAFCAIFGHRIIRLRGKMHTTTNQFYDILIKNSVVLKHSGLAFRVTLTSGAFLQSETLIETLKTGNKKNTEWDETNQPYD